MMSAEESDVQKICNCISVLISDIHIADSSKNLPEYKDIKEAFSFELKRNVHLAFRKIEKYSNLQTFVTEYIQPCFGEKCESCDYLKFLQLCLVFLKLLKLALIEETESTPTKNDASNMPVPKGLLSISQLKIFQKCLQFTVALGILPNLLRGIGIPLSKRLKHAIILEHFTSESTLYQKHIQIAVCLDTLVGCLDCEAMQSTILSYHGTDILAALLQLCHAPIKKIDKNEIFPIESTRTGKIHFKSMLTSIKDNSIDNEAQIINMMHAHRKYFIPHLEAFLKQICPSLLMWELLLFQGTPVKTEGQESEMALTKVPSWLRKICNQMLTDMILQSHGIADLVQVVLDKVFDGDIQSGNVDNVRLEAVARIITYNPVRHISVEDYIEQLSKQVFQLLHLKGSQMDNLLKYVASYIILQFCERDIQSTEKYFLVKLLKPIWCCVRQMNMSTNVSNSQVKAPCVVVVKESDLTTCIEDLHQIFVTSDSLLSRKYLSLLFPYSHCLCNMFFFLLKGKSFLKSKMKNLINAILRNSGDEKALSLLHAVSFSSNKNCGVYITTVSFASGDEGGVVAVTKSEEEFPDEIIRYHAILDLLSELQNKNLNRSYILLVLKEFCTFHLESKDNIMAPENIKAGILFNALLQELSEWNVDIGEALMSNISEVIDILMTLLESVCNCRSDATFYEKTLWVVLMILNSILESDDQLTSTDWASLKKCLPSLQKLQKSDIDSDLKEIIFSIIIHIATHGAACKNGIEIMKEFMANFPDQTANIKVSEQSLIDIVEKFDRECGVESPSVKSKASSKPTAVLKNVSISVRRQGSQSEKNVPKQSSKKSVDSSKAFKPDDSIPRKKSRFEAVVGDIKQDCIPIKGHGLITLGKLLNIKDADTLRNKKDILKILQENIDHEDSYVYLSAIQDLAVLADVDIELVLPIVLSVYQKGEEKPDLILKLGEVLLKICNSLGDLVHKYRDLILHAYLVATKHKDPQIRSSALSNLGQACICLKFNISGHWLQEILICVLSFLKTDKDLEVRRCAVMVIYLLLKGVGKDMIKVLENEIKTIYTQLKIVYTVDNDDVLRLHAQLALEEINIIMKELLCSKGTLTKEIRILP